MAASDYPGRRFQEGQLASILGIPVEIVPNRQFLISVHDPFPDVGKQKRVVMENFYRKMRRHFDVLMEGEVPRGGQWNFDAANRKPLPKGFRPPPLLQFQPDPLTQEVIQEVKYQERGVGTTDGFDLAVTRDQALQALDDFIDHRLPEFGPYEDAMSSEHDHLYHSKLSAYLNIGLLEPMEVIRSVEAAYMSGSVPINSAEGFIRQVIGWREYIYWNYWRLMPDLLGQNYWGAERSLPDFFWDGTTEMNCLQRVISRAISTGYNHHIERLMVLCNFCLLAGIDPQEVNEWFLTLYIDAYDWVMAPNVVGMGLNADGGKIATKPYIASSNYINKMSDYCGACSFDQRKRHGPGACPFNYLYWNFLIGHEKLLRSNPRMGRNVLSLRHLDRNERIAVQQEAARFFDSIWGVG
jgi:deoxyribodipyrimidine photolyase-related protein